MITAVKGMNDMLPGAAEAFLDSALWELVLGRTAELLNGYGYRRVLLPVVEETMLFARGIGEDTDIVGKEMYTFTDRGGRSLTLRPEGTAGAVRAYIEHNLGRTSPVQRWWYVGPMFRAESPQKGRYRQFYQVGAELFAAGAPAADAELLILLTRLCEALGIEGFTARVNSLGDPDSRAAYRDVLRTYLSARVGELCESCQRRAATNPLRVLDCKRPACRAVASGAPDIASAFTEPARLHFEAVLRLLDAARVPYVRDPRSTSRRPCTAKACASSGRQRMPSISPRTASASMRCSIGSVSATRPTASPAVPKRPRASPARSGSRCSSGRPTCSAAVPWPSCKGRSSSTASSVMPSTRRRREPCSSTSFSRTPSRSTSTPCATAESA